MPRRRLHRVLPSVLPRSRQRLELRDEVECQVVELHGLMVTTARR
jgi:hypothetical protein